MRVATIIITDEVNIIVKGLTLGHYEEVSNVFAVYVKGYMHQVKVKLGIWDGKIRFFKKNGESYFKLIPEIIPELKDRNYEIKIVDRRVGDKLILPLIDKNFFVDRNIGLIENGKKLPLVLGEHQVRGVNALTAFSGGIFEGGTGAGKTLMLAILCYLYEEELNYKCIIIVPTSDLIDQTREELQMVGVDVGVYDGYEKDISHVHLVSTWQALQNNKNLVGQYQVVLVDECHGVTGGQLQDILNNYAAKCRVRMGLTGTLPEEPIDQMAVKITLGVTVETVEASELIAIGWLAELKLYCYTLIEDLHPEYETYLEAYIPGAEEDGPMSYKKFKQNAFVDFLSEKKHLQKRPERLKFIATMIQQPTNNTLVLVPNVEFGRRLTKLIPNAHFIYGADKKAVRKELYNSFNDRSDLIVITTFQLASTGLNIKRIFNMFLIDANKSFVQVIQSIGRGLRKAHDKDSVRVYDVHSDLKFAKRHLSKRKKHYTTKNYPFKTNSIDYIKMAA